MERTPSFRQNLWLLTGFSLLMSGIAMGFQAWLSHRIGSEGLGLYQLTISVVNLLATVAVAGMRFTTTRLVAEYLGRQQEQGLRDLMHRCLGYACMWGMLAALLMVLLAEPVSRYWIKDMRAAASLRLSALSMPCISLCAALGGYFTACGRIWKSSLVHLAELLSVVVLVPLLLVGIDVLDLQQSCRAVTLGRVAADGISLILMLTVYSQDRKAFFPAGRCPQMPLRHIVRLALPLALSAFIRSLLTTGQQLLIPIGLRASGLSAQTALSDYGVLQGMVMPLLLFPSCVLASLSELIVPRLTSAQVRRNVPEIKRAAGESILRGLWYSLAAASIFLIFSKAIGESFFHNSAAGVYISLLAPLVPVMYTDMVVDGCLKGLGQQVWYMWINLLDGILGLVLMILLLPRMGIRGYLWILYLTELFNFTLSLLRLRPFLTGRRS